MTCYHVIEGIEIDDIFLRMLSLEEEKLFIPLKSLLNKKCYGKYINKDIDLAVFQIYGKYKEESILGRSVESFAKVDDYFEGNYIHYLGFPLGIGSGEIIHPVFRSGVVSYVNFYNIKEKSQNT